MGTYVTELSWCTRWHTCKDKSAYARQPKYRNRKGDVTTNVLGVCSQDAQFIYVLSGWEGSAADGRMLRDALTRRNGLKIPQGKYPTSLDAFSKAKN